MNAQAIQKKMNKYMKTATPEQVIKEFEGLGVEFIELPTVTIKHNRIYFWNLQRKGSSNPALVLDRAEATLYYIELHKFLTNDYSCQTKEREI